VIFLWLIIYLVEGTPNIINNNGNDAAWIITGVICLILTILGRD
jgi:hypothetical protein